MSEQTAADPAIPDEAPETRDDTSSKPRKRRSASTPRSSKRGRPPARTAKAALRRIATKAEQIADTDEDTRRLAAELTGAASPGSADLTTTIMAARTSTLDAAVADLTIIQAGSIPEAVVHLVGMSGPELQALTRLVAAFSDQELPAQLPDKSTDAALVLVDPVRTAQIDEDSLQRLLHLLAT